MDDQLTWVLVGALIGVPFGVLANFLTDGLRKRGAQRSSKQRAARRAELEKNLEEARKYHEEPLELIKLLAARLVLINILWIAQEVIDYILGFIANGTYSIYLLAHQNLPVDQFTSTVNTIGSFIGITILSIILRVGIRVYTLAKRVITFDSYSAAVQAELANLIAKDRQQAATPTLP